ncbi:MAG: hypothetical protein RLZZ306_2595 [Bacteroidota bacterium]|jgi:hypothetical protein
MKKTILSFALMIFVINATFAIPAKPFRLLINKEYKLFDIKPFDEMKVIMPIAVLKTAEPIKSINNSKISLKIALDENYKAKLTWVSAVGHKAKRYIIQISHDKETFFDLKDVEVIPTQEERQLYTFVDGRTYIGIKYYRILAEDETDKTVIYAPVKITLEAIPAPQEMVKCLQTEENNVIHIRTGDSRLIPILTTETGMGIPCDYKYSEATQTGILKPLYYLAGGNYHLKVRLGNNESKYVVSVSDIDGMNFQ